MHDSVVPFPGHIWVVRVPDICETAMGSKPSATTSQPTLVNAQSCLRSEFALEARKQMMQRVHPVEFHQLNVVHHVLKLLTNIVTGHCL